MDEPLILIVGRADSSSIRVRNNTVSRRHCTITLYSPEQMFVSDADSANGTMIHMDGKWEQVNEPRPITMQTMIKLGEYTVSVHHLLTNSPEAMMFLAKPSQTPSPANQSAKIKRDPRTGAIIKK